MDRKVNWTTQRRIIFDLIVQSEDHPTANDLMEGLRQHGHQFAYGTVYNSLRYLVDIGMIQELNLGDAANRYDARTEDHIHILCDNCGQISEAAIPLPRQWIEQIAASTAYDVARSDIILHGLCAECRGLSRAE